jgi:quercetin dioxygenase-like cupin family protein
LLLRQNHFNCFALRHASPPQRLLQINRRDSRPEKQRGPRVRLKHELLSLNSVKILTMPFLNYNTGTAKEIFPGIKAVFNHSEKLTVGKVKLDPGAVVTEHHHPHEQWTLVLEGKFEFTVSGETKVIGPGEVAYIPSGAVHAAKALTPVTVIDVFNPPRDDFR